MEFLTSFSLYEWIFYFMIYSFIGWTMESTFKSLLYQKPINSGFLHGPFIPIYAVGALVIVMFFSSYRGNITALFFLGFIFMTLIEYITGVVMEKIFNISWWDYSGNLLNIGGKICLENSIYWGLLTVIQINWLFPFIQSQVERIPVSIGDKISTAFIIYFIIDYTLTIVEVLNIGEKIKQLAFIKDNSIILATTNKVAELKKEIIKKSKRLISTYPKLRYLKLNRKLRDILNEIRFREKQ